MKVVPRYIILIVAATIALVLGYVAFRQFSSNSSYPSLDKQRAALAHRPWIAPTRILDSADIINDLEYLASDTCEGRGLGSPGHALAKERIAARMRQAGLDSFDKTLIQNFRRKYNYGQLEGSNIIGWIKGTLYPEKYIVISAHYDHLGKSGSNIYYGASDNASGTACLLAMAVYFKQNPHQCSLIFAAFDMEEIGISGSSAFVENLPSPLSLSNIRLNLNVDMIARNDNNEIFVCGIYHSPSLIYAVKETQYKTNANLLMGHDTGSIYDNWTNLSDHLSFHKKGIPFLYIGVEDHADYHKTTDTYDKINYSSYIENCNMIALMARNLRP